MNELDPKFISNSSHYLDFANKKLRALHKMEKIERDNPGFSEAAIAIVAIKNDGEDTALGFKALTRETNLIPDGTMPVEHPFKDEEPPLAALYLGHRAFADTRNAYESIDSDSSDEVSVREYTEATDTLAAVRHYMTTKEQAAYTALIAHDHPESGKPVPLSPSIAWALQETPYAQKEIPLARRLISGKLRQKTEPDLIDTLQFKSPESLNDIVHGLTEARAWLDLYTASTANLMAIDTLNSVARYQHESLRRSSRDYDRLISSIKKHSRDYAASGTKDEEDGILNINRIDQGLLDFNNIVNTDIALDNLPGMLAERVALVRKTLLASIAIRNTSSTPLLETALPSSLDYVPTNAGIFMPKREVIDVTPTSQANTIDQEALAKQRSDERAARLEARRMSDLQALEEAAAANERDLPKLASLNQLVTDYKDILTPFYAQTGKQLRAIGITGSNSLEFTMRKTAKDSVDDRLLDKLRVYHGLTQLIEQRQSNDHILSLLDQAETIARQHAELTDATVLEGTTKPEVLRNLIESDLTWLSEHWGQLRAAIAPSSHNSHANNQTLDQIAQFLEAFSEGEGSDIVAPDNAAPIENEVEAAQDNDITLDNDIVEDTSLPIIDQPHEATETTSIDLIDLARLNRQAEQLDWVVLPTDTVTLEDIVQIANRALRDSGNKHKGIDQSRITSLLDFRNHYGGELFRSAERTLGDSNNLYFVLKFTNPQDKKTYAIAENIVFGNATYVIREDTMPLEPGESVLTAVTLSRKDARELGARRIIHTSNAAITHEEKITSTITELSRRPSLD